MTQVNSEAFTSASIKVLSAFQVGILDAAADGEPFVVLEVTEGIDQSYADYLETLQLEAWGFLEDVSHRFRELVQDARCKYNRGFRVMIATPSTVQLFGGATKRSVN